MMMLGSFIDHGCFSSGFLGSRFSLNGEHHVVKSTDTSGGLSMWTGFDMMGVGWSFVLVFGLPLLRFPFLGCFVLVRCYYWRSPWRGSGSPTLLLQSWYDGRWMVAGCYFSQHQFFPDPSSFWAFVAHWSRCFFLFSASTMESLPRAAGHACCFSLFIALLGSSFSLFPWVMLHLSARMLSTGVHCWLGRGLWTYQSSMLWGLSILLSSRISSPTLLAMFPCGYLCSIPPSFLTRHHSFLSSYL